jgi:shikimate kinase
VGPPHVAIIGMPGVGKSTVAARLAERLSMEVRDLDDVIAEAAGCDVPTIFDREGEPGFRARESAALADLLEPDAPRRAVACGGGVVVTTANRELLARRATTVLLEATLEVLAARLAAEDHGRPLLAGDLAERLSTLAAERGDLYAEVADLRVDAGSLEPDAVVERIVEVLA